MSEAISQCSLFESYEMPNPLALARDSSFGRTCQASSPTKATRSVASSQDLSARLNRWCQPQDQENGRVRVMCLDPKEQPRGGFWTPNISEWPNDAAVCSLSDVLVTDAIPPKYFLSSMACGGILRRAERRGKELPAALMIALQAVAGQ